MICSLYNHPRFYDWYMKKLAGWIEIYRERELLEVIDPCIEDNAVVLDICCGTGANCILLGKRYPKARIIGIDINPVFIGHAEKKINDLAIKNVSLMELEITKCVRENIGDDHIDIAICALGLSVIPEWKKAIDQILSILKPSGYFIAFDLYIDTHEWTGKLSNLLTALFFGAHHDRLILDRLKASFTEIETIKIDVKPESKTELFIFKGRKAAGHKSN